MLDAKISPDRAGYGQFEGRHAITPVIYRSVKHVVTAASSRWFLRMYNYHRRFVSSVSVNSIYSTTHPLPMARKRSTRSPLSLARSRLCRLQKRLCSAFHLLQIVSR